MPGAYSHKDFIKWLALAAEGKLLVNAINVAKALRSPSFIHILDKKGTWINQVKSLKECVGFEVTRRGRELIAEDKTLGSALPFSTPAEMPRPMQHWLSALRRVMRNCPEGLRLACEDGELLVLAKDRDGKVKNDAAHLVESLGFPGVVKT
jgi:hypothetical protein